jgi:hypothetical protein
MGCSAITLSSISDRALLVERIGGQIEIDSTTSQGTASTLDENLIQLIAKLARITAN